MAEITDFKIKNGLVVTTTATINGDAESTSTLTGALIVSGGVGIGGNLNVAGEITASKLTIEYTTITTTLVETDDIIKTSNLTDSVGTDSGALVVAGGAGIGGNLYVGGSIVGTASKALDSDTATTSSFTNDILGGANGSLVYQSDTDETGFIPIATTSGWILFTNGFSPYWAAPDQLVVNNAGTANQADKWTSPRTITLDGDLSGIVSIDGSTDVTLTATIKVDSVELGTDTTGSYVASGETSGWGINGSTNTESGVFSITIDSTSSNTSSTLVFRDENGDFSANQITADLIGIATTATNVENGQPGELVYQISSGQTGFVSAGTAGDVLVSNGTSSPAYQNTLTLSGTTAASSTTTGALQVLGGVGIGENLYVGNNLVVTKKITGLESSGELLSVGNSTIGDDKFITIKSLFGNLEIGRNSSTNAYIVSNMAVGVFDIVHNATKIQINSSDQVVIPQNTPSTDSTSGALIITGGVGIGENLNIGGNLNVDGTFQANGPAIFQNSVVFNGSSTYVYSSATVYTDNIINLHTPVGGDPENHTWTADDGNDIGHVFHYYDGEDKNAALILAADSKYLEWYSNGTEVGNVFTGTSYGTFKTGSIRLADTTSATSVGTGALTVAGGAGIAGDLYVGGTINGTIVGNIEGSVTTASTVNTVLNATTDTHYLTFVDSNNAAATGENIYTTSSVYTIPSSGELWAKQLRQDGSEVAIGRIAGNFSQGSWSVAIGDMAGHDTQGFSAVAIGETAGSDTQGDETVAIGYAAGGTNQGVRSVSIGYLAGTSSQGESAVAIGEDAGGTNQGQNAIAIGKLAGVTTQSSNSIILNASGLTQDASNAGFYVNPVRADSSTSATSIAVFYNSETKELTTASIATLTVTSATNIANGQAGEIVYQIAPGQTGFVSTATAGDVLVSGGTSSPIYQNTLTLSGTTSATSTTTGALVVAGGVGIGGDLYVAGTIYAENVSGGGTGGSASTATNLAGGDVGSVPYQLETSSTTFLAIGDTGTVMVSLGDAPSWQNTLTLNGTTSATNTTTGALVVAGGVGIGGEVYLGNALNYTSNNASMKVFVEQTEDGISSLVFQGSQGKLLSIDDTFTGTIFAVAGTSGIPNIEVLDSGKIILAEFGNYVEILSTTASNSTSSGALVVAGGVGIGGDLYVGGTINGTFNGTISGSVSEAINLSGGTTGSLPYQSATSSTAFISIASTSGWVLTSNGSLPVWSENTAVNIANGQAGEIVYQIAPGQTGFVSTTTAGDVLVSGGTGSPLYQNTLTLSGTTSATSTTTGALVVAGGVGIGGDLWIGGEIVASKLTIEYTTVTTTLVQTDDVIQTTNTSSSNSTATGALVVAGGAGIGGDLYVGGTINGTIVGSVSGTASTATNLAGGDTGSIPYQASTGSTTFVSIATTSGWILSSDGTQPVWNSPANLNISATDIAGGLAGQLLYQIDANDTGFVSTATAGNVLVSGGTGSPVYQNTLTLSGTTAASSTTTGALTVAGGVGIGGNLYVGGEIVATKLTIEYTTVTTTLVQTDDVIQTTNATAASSTTTGALIVAGGAGIGGNLYVGGTINGTIVGTVSGTASTATNLAGGASGSIPYQSNTGSTTFVSIATTSGWILSSNGTQPVWTELQAGSSVTIENDTSSSNRHFLTFVNTSSGTASVIKTSAQSGIVYIPQTGNFGIATSADPAYTLEVNGSFAATTKSFIIDHPTKTDMRLRHGSLEGPENGVYVRGRLVGDTIVLPDYWVGLVDETSITVSLTAVGSRQDLYVKSIENNSIIVGNDTGNIDCFYTVFAERKDVDKLVVEIPKE